MGSFSDFSNWGFINILAILFISLLLASILKKNIPLLKASLIPTSVLAGIMLLLVSTVYRSITGELIYNTPFFGGNGMTTFELITYHCLALGFIASSMKMGKEKFSKKRAREIFDSGVTTVSTYLLQAVLGLGITLLIAYLVMPELFKAAGVILPFGFGQGTGQALNYGNIYETEHGFVGGANFGLTIAALGFLSASLGGVIHLNILKRKKGITSQVVKNTISENDKVHAEEIPMSGSMDKLAVQIATVVFVYFCTHLVMYLLGQVLLPGLSGTIYGFNFLIGVLLATALKGIMNALMKAKIVKKQHINNFLMDRISNTCFDLMVTAGIAAIRLDLIAQYWHVLLLLGVVGMISTYLYNKFIAKKLFPEYEDEQFLAMYGMLTGTASTGIILLRELDGNFKTPAADNLVYQSLPAIVFGFPMMLLANLAPTAPELTFGILVAFFIVMNVILFRNQLFRKKQADATASEPTEE
ncbi:MAG: hypothetical protein E7367_02865 [Clostridiales bacterium]|nr:hypothetical protein [Clostridiales bacterium]